jgi:membrane protease YdiL (CAAX protease family)
VEKTFIEQARTGKRLTNPWLAIPLSFIVLVTSILLGKMILGVLLPVLGSAEEINSSLFTGGLAQMLSDVIELGPAILLIWLIVSLYEKRSFKTLGFGSNGALKKLLLGALFGFSVMAAYGAIGYMTGALVLVDENSITQGISVGMLFAFIGLAVQTSAEEIVYRGWLTQVLCANWGYSIGAVASAVFFALPHGLNDDITILALVNIVLLSYFFALYAIYQQSLWGVIGFHWFYNWTQFSFIGLDVVPDNNFGGAVFNLEYTDKVPFITSGVVAEDGPIITLIAIIGGVVMSVIFRKRQAKGAC